MVEVPRGEGELGLQRQGRPEDPARAGDHRGPGPAPAPAGAGRQRDRQPEADRDAPRPRPRGAREGVGQRQAGRAHGRRGAEEGRHRQGRGVHGRGRVVRHTADRHREGGRGPQGAGPPVVPGQRPGQGGRAAERHRAPAQAGRAQQAPVPARPGQDAGAGQQGDGLAVRDRRRGRPDLRRGAREDRGALRQGQGHVRAHRDVGGVTDARGGAGGRQQRGPDPPRPDPRPARPGPAPATAVAAPGRRARARPRGRAWRGRRSATVAAYGSTTRSSRWTTSCGMPSGSWVV